MAKLFYVGLFAVVYPGATLADPSGAEVISGQVKIDTSVAGTTTITNSPNAIIHWQNFNIAENETTRFIQQNSQSAVLNRIMGGNPSTILGQLVSNGKVLLINPNGIVFGAHSLVDTQGLIASSLNLSNEDFLRGNYHFIAGGPTGNIANEGIIRAGTDGNIILIAPSIENSGVLKTEGGKITLAAGRELTLTSLDDPNIRYQVKAPNNSVLNLGKLLSEGGAINVFAGSITHSGHINADSVALDAQGNVHLLAKQDISLTEQSTVSANTHANSAGSIEIKSSQGTVVAAGSITAQAIHRGSGGTIAVLGKHVGLVGRASIDASGAAGGGKILVGGGLQGNDPDIPNAQVTYLGKGTQLKANADVRGKGGDIIVWADNTTRAHGQISAKGGRLGGDGGFVETSARHLETSDIQVDASAAKGHHGQWLLDPNDVVIDDVKSDVHVGGNPNFVTNEDNAVIAKQSIETALDNGTSVTVTTGMDGKNSQEGNITVASAISKSAGGDAKLTLTAHNNIDIKAPIKASSGKLHLNLTPDSDNDQSGRTVINSTLELNSGALTLYGDSSASAAASIRNADLIIPGTATSVQEGNLRNIGIVTMTGDAHLTINQNSQFNQLTMSGGLLSGSGTVTVVDNFHFNHGALEGSGKLITKGDTSLASGGTAYLEKNWTNLGLIDWQGAGDLRQKTSAATFNNESSGVISINEAGSEIALSRRENLTERHLAVTRFNNRGLVSINSGTLTISSSGNDSGRYEVGNAGELVFTDNTKYFNGAAIISNKNPVTFSNGEYHFIKGSYIVPETIINNAYLAFRSGSVTDLPSLTLNQGTLAGPGPVHISEHFNFQGGALAGGGSLTTLLGATTTLANQDTAHINKRWENFGEINWNGQADNIAGTAAFINGNTGIFNVSSDSGNGVLSLEPGHFTNEGILNITDATLRLFSPGTDSGGYLSSQTGYLHFIDHNRTFLDGAQIESQTPVVFLGGEHNFNNGSQFTAPEIVINDAKVTFSTGNPIVLNALTLTHAAFLKGKDQIEVKEAFNFFSGIATGTGPLLTHAKSRTQLYDHAALVNKPWDNYGSVTFSAPPSADIARPNILGLALTPKPWNNYGDIAWIGPALPANALSNLVILNNRESGSFLVTNENSSSVRELKTAAFNNQGITTVSSGVLAIYSDGKDTGRYDITGTGQLQFFDGGRMFKDGSVINSDNPVSFLGGHYIFLPEASYSTPKTRINDATVNFIPDTKLADLDLLGGHLAASNGLEVNGVFNWTGGALSGAGHLNFTHQFNYRDGLLTATGMVTINDQGDELLLPAMPSITSVNAKTNGKLVLTGDIVATGEGTAIQLVAGKNFIIEDNGATLNASNGRWLIYSDHPANTVIGALAPDFKHYGCKLLAGCNDNFNVSNATGDGLLYRHQPFLVVTPGKQTSIYGDRVTFTSDLTGFIDGDNFTSAGITGTAHYGTDAKPSESTRPPSVGQYNVFYVNGLQSELGYLFKDDPNSVHEWSIVPRGLTINALPAKKWVGENDPVLLFMTSGLLPGDAVTGALARAEGESVGFYPIYLGNVTAGNNYAIEYIGANFTIKAIDAADRILEFGTNRQQNSQLTLNQQLDLLQDDDPFKMSAATDSESPARSTNKRGPQQCR